MDEGHIELQMIFGPKIDIYLQLNIGYIPFTKLQFNVIFVFTENNDFPEEKKLEVDKLSFE